MTCPVRIYYYTILCGYFLALSLLGLPSSLLNFSCLLQRPFFFTSWGSTCTASTVFREGEERTAGCWIPPISRSCGAILGAGNKWFWSRTGLQCFPEETWGGGSLKGEKQSFLESLWLERPQISVIHFLTEALVKPTRIHTFSLQVWRSFLGKE